MGWYKYAFGAHNWEAEFRMRCQAAYNRVSRLQPPVAADANTPLRQQYFGAVDAAVDRVTVAGAGTCSLFSPHNQEVDHYLISNVARANLLIDVTQSVLANVTARQTAEAVMVSILSEIPPANSAQHFP